MASLEMLKKLLDEFAEKEAQTTEEINVVTQQITDLEGRVEAARARQAGIAGDREKLNEMKAHYAGGAIARSERAQASGGVPLPMQTPQPLAAAAGAMPPLPPQQLPPQPVPMPAAAAPAPAPVPAPVAEAPKPNRFDLLDLFSPNDNTPEPVVEQQPVAQPAPQPAPAPIPAPQPVPQAPAAAAAPESPKEEEDDTVKSINDALRGLFR